MHTANAELVSRVEAALGAGDLPGAIAIARQALDSGVEHPLFLNLRAHWHERDGRDNEAFADLLRARTLAPQSATICNALGLAHSRRGQSRNALACFDAAIASDPDFAPAHFNKAWTSEELGDLAGARQSYLRAHQLNPAVAEPLAGLAAIATRGGDWQAVQSFAERALAINPDQPIAVRTLAAAEISTGNANAGEARLERLLSRANIAPADRAACETLLGDLYDSQNRFDEAFARYKSANDILRVESAPRYEGHGVETLTDYLRWLTDYLRNIDPSQWSVVSEGLGGDPDLPERHIFMIGFPRSGTTLLETVLGGNPIVTTSRERETLDDAAREFLGSKAQIERLADLRGAGLRRHRRAYWARVREHGIDVTGRTFIDKQPYNTFKLPLIAKLFPQAKIVFSLRDPRDVVLSCFRRQFRMSAPNFELLSLERAAKLYDATMRIAQVCREKLPLQLHTLRHEDLISDFEGQMKSVCDFLELPWDDGMRNFAASPKIMEITTPSAVQVTRGINAEGVGQWRRYAKQMAPILPIIAPWVERYGYPPD